MLDFILILTFLYFLVAGFYYGFVAGAIRFLGIILGLYLALVLYIPAAKILNKYFYINEKIAEVFSALVIFMFIFVITIVFKIMVKDKVEENAKLRTLDKIVGGLLGIVLYIFVLFGLVKYSKEDNLVYEFTSQSKIIMNLKKLMEK